MVKICGLTRLQDVLLARDLGAWALGFVFAPSPRRLVPAKARLLLEAAGRASGKGVPPLAVGVFGDVPADEIARIVEEVGLGAVQLHGTSGPPPAEVRMALTARGAPALIIQAIGVAPRGGAPGALRKAIAQAREEADLILLDTRAGERFGGTGTAFPWRLAGEEAGDARFLVAGGIGPGNVERALDESAAWGVDVSSGVEVSPGVKDAQLVADLIAQVSARGNRSRVAAVNAGHEQQEGMQT